MKKLLYIFLGLSLTFACSDDGDGDGDSVNCDVVYLDSNGITIKACENAQVGESGTINGITYTIVNKPTLYEMANNGDDLSTICTSRVVGSMGWLFSENTTNPMDNPGFNGDISSWDVSNVTGMTGMFNKCYAFNQPIGDWDVSSVTDMRAMFNFAEDFNQPIGDWDVSSVTSMGRMFGDAINFNQDISSWSVDNVTFCDGFSLDSPLTEANTPNFTNCIPN